MASSASGKVMPASSIFIPVVHFFDTSSAGKLRECAGGTAYHGSQRVARVDHARQQLDARPIKCWDEMWWPGISTVLTWHQQ
jgi:hypothetical protein